MRSHVDATIKTNVAILDGCSTVPAMGKATALEAGQANLPFGELVISSLRLLGVDHFVVSPGSRSTPLTMALSGNPEHVTVVLDERSAAFRALGRIKATRRPVALVCTSGSAGAHYYPAVIEAREAGLPLVVLTADRPPELRHCHAGQTIDQQNLFGKYPLMFAELPLPSLDADLLRQVREICRVAVGTALGTPSGPVHLNCPFREPFFNESGKSAELDQSILENLKPLDPVECHPSKSYDLPERTLILAGPRNWADKDSEMEALLQMSQRFGFPILADGSNPLRYHPKSGNSVIIHYDRIVRTDAWADLKPEAVILWGEPPTSKILRAKLADLDIQGYLVSSAKQGINPVYGNIEWVGSSLKAFVDQADSRGGQFANRWTEVDRHMEEALERSLGESHPLFEGDVHRLLSSALPEGSSVVYASSLAIRDAEWFMPRGQQGFRPFSQRGANGIDGTVSLARGVVAGTGKPAYLVTGDLAFLHDGGGLAGAGNDNPGLFVILINNQGGGIFEFLPVAQQAGSFEELYATAQEVDMGSLVGAHAGEHQICDTVEQLASAIENWDGNGLFVAEVPIDRKISKELHRRYLVMEN
jgi:2-succinyl-5-enolpyruvyl-6-hydroxy-3-cyclohexene-1-carboxylate synthase